MVPASVMNELFSHKLDGAETKTKVAEYAGSYIRDKLREVSFARKIVPPRQISKAECQVSTEHDTLVYIDEVEPQSKALALTFRGQPRARFIRGERYPIGFFTIASELFQKTEQELMVYKMPITKIIEENSVKDIQEIEDREFLRHVEACVQALQQEANGGSVTSLNASGLQGATPPVEFSVRKGELARNAPANDATVRPLQRPDIVNLYKMLDGNRLRAEQVLMTEVDYDDILQWTLEDAGSKIQSETLVDGYKYNTLLGRAFTRTIKGDILRAGNLYTFTAPAFFGKFFILNNTKFWIDKVANLIKFMAWQDIGMGFGNVAAVRKTELYSADATSVNADNLQAQFLPVAEDALGAVNNRVEQGVRFPKVLQY